MTDLTGQAWGITGFAGPESKSEADRVVRKLGEIILLVFAHDGLSRVLRSGLARLIAAGEADAVCGSRMQCTWY